MSFAPSVSVGPRLIPKHRHLSTRVKGLLNDHSAGIPCSGISGKIGLGVVIVWYMYSSSDCYRELSVCDMQLGGLIILASCDMVTG